MRNLDLNRINLKKIELGERPIRLKRVDYEEPIIVDGYLTDANGNRIGTKGDMYTKHIMDEIITRGTLDYYPRPHYEDFYEGASYNEKTNTVVTNEGEEIILTPRESVKIKDNGVEIWSPSHTLSVSQGIECTYDLAKGDSPMITLRPIATKASIAEILWIYQQQSNDLVLFDELLGRNTWEENHKINNWWDDWAIRDDNGNYVLNEAGHPTIGTCYGETIRRHSSLQEKVINAIKNNQDGRRNITCMWQEDDFLEPHGLKPCAFLTIWNVRHEWDGEDYLDMTLVQRSSDFATAGCINQVQYVTLQTMVANELGLTPGTFTWKPINIQIYDRHLDQSIEMLNREPITCNPKIEVNPSKQFSELTPADVKITDYPREFIKKKNPQLKFPLGV